MLRSAHIWLPGYLRSIFRRPCIAPAPRHLMFCVADHFEPFRGGASAETALRLVREWAGCRAAWNDEQADADGMRPKHTFFYPQEEYDWACLRELEELCGTGFGEVEIHLHHRNDTAEGLRSKLCSFRDTLRHEHGFLGSAPDGAPRYGFVHGNWALCNSRPDGDWCGVNEELGILSGTGCYADFTFPSAPSPTQPRTVNAIYRAADRPGRPRGHDRGEEAGKRFQVSGVREEAGKRCPASALGATAGRQVSGVRFQGGRDGEVESLGGGERRPDIEHRTSNIEQRATSNEQRSTINERRLLLIHGPLGLDWRRRKWGLLPRIENGGISGYNPLSPERIDLCVRQWIHVRGRPEWVFVKLHTHGCAPGNREALFGRAMRDARAHLSRRYNDGREWKLHYVTARETYNIVRAAEDGMAGEPGEYRDYEIKPPPGRGREIEGRLKIES